MTGTEKAIKKSIEGGYKSPNLLGTEVGYYNNVFLDPLFWSCLGKAEGWSVLPLWRYGETSKKSGESLGGIQYPQWQYNQHRFIDHLASNGTPDEYFDKLLNNK